MINEWIQDHFFLDIDLLPVWGLIVLIGLAILLIAVFWHELGHVFYFRARFKKKIKVSFIYKNIFNWYWEAGQQADYDMLTDKEYRDVMAFGIIFGMIPIFCVGFISEFWLLLIIPYMAGSWKDIKELAKAMETLPKTDDE